MTFLKSYAYGIQQLERSKIYQNSPFLDVDDLYDVLLEFETDIVCFDMSNKQFGMIRLPKIVFPLGEENFISGIYDRFVLMCIFVMGKSQQGKTIAALYTESLVSIGSTVIRACIIPDQAVVDEPVTAAEGKKLGVVKSGAASSQEPVHQHLSLVRPVEQPIPGLGTALAPVALTRD
ncbi:Uncharacterized protein Fot_11238 [Forsythia ovata]|uniref:Uncharacterized protein n=1 Tax=Forsythia ovata TaxID=205694 RepID=A0ABD1WM00_9LAMI